MQSFDSHLAGGKSVPRSLSRRRASRYSSHAPVVCQALEPRMLLSAATLVEDITTGPTSSVSFGSNIAFGDSGEVALGNKFIFAATDASHGMEPWVSDGTQAGTVMLRDINTSGSSNPTEFTLGNGVVYFTASDGTSTQIWKTDGTPAGTVQVTAVPSAPDARGAVFAAASGPTVFFTEDGDASDSGRVSSLWATDGSAPGKEHEITNFGSLANSNPIPLAASNGRLYFNAGSTLPGALPDATTLWTSDGATASPIAINSTGDSAFISTSPNGTAIFNGQAYFGAFDGSTGTGLWTSDGTSAGTHRVGTASFTNTSPADLTVSGSKLYFVADSGQGLQIWSTDGKTVAPATALLNVNGIQNLTDVNGTLFFAASLNGAPKEIFRLDGNVATPIPLPSDGSGTIANQLTNVNGHLFFSAQNAAGQQVLFDYDGTSITPVTGDPGLTPLGLLNVNGTLFYSADEDATGRELYAATPAGTNPIGVDVTASTSTVMEGDKTKVTFHATVNGATASKYAWNFTGHGKIGKPIPAPAGATQHASFEKVIPPAGSVSAHVTVTCAVRTTDGRLVTGTAVVSILNEAPSNVKVSSIIPKIVGVPTTHHFLPTPFTVNWNDPGIGDTFDVEWKVQSSSLLSGLPTVFQTVTHTNLKAHHDHFRAGSLPSSGLYQVTVDVTDASGALTEDTFTYTAT